MRWKANTDPVFGGLKPNRPVIGISSDSLFVTFFNSIFAFIYIDFFFENNIYP